MIALCLTHAGHADANAYDKEYLRSLKRQPRDKTEDIKGQLAWMRRNALILMGGNWYFETPVILRIGSTSAISLGRDPEGYLLLNLRMPSTSGQPRARIEENFFTVGRHHVADVQCAARGRTICIDYPNGDRFMHEYRDIDDEEQLRHQYGGIVGSTNVSQMIDFPVTVVEVTERTTNSGLEFGPAVTKLGGAVLTGCWSIRNGTGIFLDIPPAQEAALFSGTPEEAE
jgi:hypothetical protein